MKNWSICCRVLLLWKATSAFDLSHAQSVHLADRTLESGIDFVHSDGSSGQRYIVETVASGLATFDFDQDGWIDILFLSGTSQI